MILFVPEACGAVHAFNKNSTETKTAYLVDVVQENSQEDEEAETQQKSSSQGHGTQKKRRRVGRRLTQVNSSQDSDSEEEDEEEAEEGASLVTRMQMRRGEDTGFAHLMFDGQSWHAKFACHSTTGVGNRIRLTRCRVHGVCDFEMREKAQQAG